MNAFSDFLHSYAISCAIFAIAMGFISLWLVYRLGVVGLQMVVR